MAELIREIQLFYGEYTGVKMGMKAFGKVDPMKALDKEADNRVKRVMI